MSGYMLIHALDRHCEIAALTKSG